MEETIKNLDMDDVLDVMKDFPWEPSFNKVIITINMISEDGELQLSNTMIDEEQYVIAAGPFSKEHYPPGSKILLDLKRMAVRDIDPNDQTQYISRIEVEPIEVNGIKYAIIEDRVIKAKYVG